MWTSAPGVLRLKEHFALGLLGFVVFWELWRSCPVAPTSWEDVVFVYRWRQGWWLGPARGACCKPARAARWGHGRSPKESTQKLVQRGCLTASDVWS